MKLDGQDLLTEKQAAAIKAIRRRCKKAGLLIPTSQMVTAACLEAYDITGDEKERRHSARSIASANLKRPAFRAALGADSDEIKTKVMELLFHGVQGTTPWGRDRQIYSQSLKILARLVLGARAKEADEDDRFSKLTNEELEAIVRGEMEMPPEPQEAPTVSGWIATHRKGQRND